MNAMKIVGICLLLVFGAASKHTETSTLQSTEDYDAQFSTESLSTNTMDSNLEDLEELDKRNSTEIDTHGDLIITPDPNEETEDDHSSENDTTVAERNTTEISTDSSSTTLSETTTLETNWRACSTNPCKNGGLCIDDPHDSKLYNCKCTHRYTGTHCQVLDNCFADKSGNLCSKGACVYTKDELSRSCECFFGRFWDEDKKKCRKADPPCFPNPCHNGTCVPRGGDFQCSCWSGYEGKTCEIQNLCGNKDYCENGKCKKNAEKKVKYCECDPDFYWNENKGKCEALKPPCQPNPCKNGGVCEPLSSNEFNCTCKDGYLGKNCEIQNFCDTFISGEDMTCENGVCMDSELSRTCSCNEGYFLDPEYNVCREIIKPCLPNPCSNEGKCIPLTEDSYNCTCSEGYSGSRCTERDYCILKGGNTYCGNSTCKNEQALRIYYCSCESGQYFDYGLRTCLDIDFCPLMQCGENEQCKDNSCECKENYKRHNSTGECIPHFCSSISCPVRDLICTEGDGIKSYQCACENGYAFDGKHCKAGANCMFLDLNNCDHICTTENDGFTCSCEENFLLKEDNRTCAYTGNLTDCTNKTCDNGICIRTEEGEKCICGPSFVEKENNCVDMCSASGHLPDGYCPDNRCETTDSGFKCVCEGKYTYSEDGITCKVRKMCDEGEDGWKTCSKRHAHCLEDWSKPEGYTCNCEKGQVSIEGGFCRDLCSINENRRQCSILGAECDVDASGEKTCKCPPYYGPFDNETACNKPASNSYFLTLPLNPSSYKKAGRSKRSTDKQSDDVDYSSIQRDIRKAMEKLFPQLLYSNVLNYRETKDYIQCKVELQFSSIDDEDLKKLQLPEVCRASKDVSSVCLVPPSLILRKDRVKTVTSIQRTNPCDAEIKEDLCGSETFCTSRPDESVFKCKCGTGFSVRSIIYPFGDSESFIENCKDINECAFENPCPENMDCHNIIGSYTCSCKPGYRTGDYVVPETNGCVEICTPNPCVHGECMEIGDHLFECKCPPGYNGLLCDLQDEGFKRARTNTIIVGAVLGGGLLVVIIISIANISRLKKKKKMLENSEHMLYATEMTNRRVGEEGTVNNAYQRD